MEIRERTSINSNHRASPLQADWSGGGQTHESAYREKDRASVILGEMPRPWQEGDYYKFPPKRRGDPWEESMKRVDLYDDEMSRSWKEDVDTLLVFVSSLSRTFPNFNVAHLTPTQAGLFSAAVTAFVIESYKWLNQNNPNNNNDILQGQVNIGVTNNQTNFLSTGSSVRINVVWFLSLILSLSSVLLGILCKQWLREHRRDTPCSSSKESLELRQLRYESLERWGVPALLASLPLFLQAALVLFFYGILDLLWSLNIVVAAVCTAATVISVSIPCLTTILPAYYLLRFPTIAKYEDDVHLCPYKSPQAWLFYKFTTAFLQLFVRLKVTFHDWASSDLYLLRTHTENRLHSIFLLRGLRWMVKTFGDSMVMANHMFYCFQTLPVDVAAYATGNTDEVSRDSVYYHFFRHSSWDPDIGRFVAELFLRQVNSHNLSAPEHSFWNLASMDFIGDGPKYQLPTEFLQQIIVTIRCYCADNRITLFDVDPLMVVCKKLWSHPDPTIRHQSTGIIDDLQAWISRTSEELQKDFIPSFASSIKDIIYSEDERAPMSALILSDKGREFIKYLDRNLAAQEIDVDVYSLQEMPPMSWQEGKGKVARLSGLTSDFFDRVSFGSRIRVTNHDKDEDEDEDRERAGESVEASDTYTVA
ncbi:hypothetical protein D9757_006414 [Collybiopsis confluens]|uniref:DUF6535 domain-containing protein n=1 Tax=Collybiopsis confluens TaxID=2823264 RepID=A0A8H5HJI2_9AGAR|nr:hypothetical protein D9757_006414 [Collybiopsis confluens]